MSFRKPVVLTFINHYLPGYLAGGPIRSLANIVERLGDTFRFLIVTQDRDAGDKSPYPGVRTGEWLTVGKAKVMYLSKNRISTLILNDIIQSVAPDLIYLNSFFDPLFTMRVLLCRKLGLLSSASIILAPRGEFSSGALDLKKEKKRLFIRVSSLIGLYRNLFWHASSALERDDISRTLHFVKHSDIYEAMNLAPADVGDLMQTNSRKEDAPLRVCFFSRISPKKNLDFALKVLGLVRIKVVFTLYGPKEDHNYWTECEALISLLPSNIIVIYERELVPTEVRQVLSEHDLFFLPTRGENYGHVIQEALSAGLPVLLSDQTPWNEVVEHGVGWVHSLNDPERFASTIENYAAMSGENILQIKAKAILFSRERTSDSKILEDNQLMFNMACYRDNC